MFLTEPTVTAIAEKLHATPAQVVLSWGVQRGTPVIPKSENEERMKANITVRYTSSRTLWPIVERVKII